MDISSLSHSRHSERSFNPVQYAQPQQLGYPGGAARPAVVGDTRAVRRVQDQQSSEERQAEGSRFLTRGAVASLTGLTGQLATAGQCIDIYA